MHDLYKPLRNKLRKQSVFESLVTAFRFMQFMDYDIPLEGKLAPPMLMGRIDRMRQGIVQWEFEILIREIVLNGNKFSKNHLDSWSEVARQINAIKRIENESWGQHKSQDDDILYELVRIAHRQFPWQRGLNQSHYARYHRLYSADGLSQIIERDYGMTTSELFQITLALTGHFLSNVALKLPMQNELNNVSSEVCEAFIRKFAISIDSLREKYSSHASYDINWAYTFNPLRQTPLVYLPGNRSLMCPIPHFLARRVTNELYFDLVTNADAFALHFGPAVQAMVGAVAKAANVSGSFKLRHEMRYGSKKSPKDTADWIISDNSAHLFVESKGARVKFRGTSDLRSHTFIDAEFIRIKGFAFQLYKTLSAALCGEYPNWKPDGRPVYPIVVTLEDWQTFGLHVQRLVFDPLAHELAAIGIDPDITKRHPLSFCSIEDFELAMIAADTVGIDKIFSRKNEGEYPQWSLGTFVSQNFSEELGNRKPTAFLEEWDYITPPRRNPT
ncbi:MAG: hypothetical protein IBJ12_00595 [Sphingomonadaceae bacterium]|nr:hypothetical protein [Sphingomonadaceae bacterium]